jgi:hypothetical protein
MAEERQYGLAAEREFRAGLPEITARCADHPDAGGSESGRARITGTGAVH